MREDEDNEDGTVLRHETLATYADVAPGAHLWLIDEQGVRRQLYNGWPFTATVALIRRDGAHYRRVEREEHP